MNYKQVMKKYMYVGFILLALSWLVSCNNSSFSSSNYMVLENVEYVDEFPQTFLLQDRSASNVDVIGIKNFIIYDSLMILSTNDEEGLWSFFSLPDECYLGKFLTRGNGPFEFIFPPRVNTEVKIVEANNTLLAYIYDSQRGKVLKMNVTESLRDNKTDISVQHDSLPAFLFNFAIIDDASFFCKGVDQHHTQQLRYLLEKGEEVVPDVLQKLNQASIEEGEDINILSTNTKLGNGNVVVEAPIGLNYINLYSLDGSLGKTICVGKELDCIEKIERKEVWDRMYTYADLRVYADFFGAVYINEDEKTYQMKRERLPSILLFDWNGAPLAELKLDHFITSFDIDFTNGNLYTLDVHSDEFYTYNIKDILAALGLMN